jgi:hypothetical protein
MNFVKFVTVIIVLLPMYSNYAQGTFLYDQQSALEGAPGEGAPTIQGSQPIGQSFTPTLSSVGFIRLWLGDATANNSAGASVYVRLLGNSITGNVISSTEPVFMPDGFGRGTNGYVNFIFSVPPTVTPGVTYFFQPVVQSGDLWHIIMDTDYNYSGGTAFGLGQPGPGYDLWFREGVFIPEPSSTLLLLSGAALVLYVRRTRTL